jgi:hypothetical protein
LGFPGSGAFMIRFLVPSKLAGSSAGAEAIIACHCAEAVAAMRMLCEELDLKPQAAWPNGRDATSFSMTPPPPGTYPLWLLTAELLAVAIPTCVDDTAPNHSQPHLALG